MTVEQKAEKYANNLLKDVTCNIGHPRARQINSIDIEDAWLYGYKEGFKDCAKSRLNVTTISDCPIKDEVQLEYAITIIKDLLFNSDEYARQRAIDFLMEEE